MTRARNPVYAIILVRTAQASALALALHWLFHWPLTGPHALGLVFMPLLCLYFVFVFVAPWSWGLPIQTRLPTQENVVALTFDDGPTLETTPAILDILARHGARATFFVLGENAARHPDLVRRIVTEGHALGIHGFYHAPFVLLSWKRVGEEIARTRAAIAQACPAVQRLRPAAPAARVQDTDAALGRPPRRLPPRRLERQCPRLPGARCHRHRAERPSRRQTRRNHPAARRAGEPGHSRRAAAHSGRLARARLPLCIAVNSSVRLKIVDARPQLLRRRCTGGRPATAVRPSDGPPRHD